jgi:hypothetical protein
MARKKGTDRAISKKDKEYWDAMARLKKAQAKYVEGPNKKKKASHNVLKNKAKTRNVERTWRGWRDSDGKSSPVVTYKKGDLEKDSPPNKDI